jgi:sugar O-acyltransferase (sialic acid O-acetyltransferase NeuD family)
MSQIFVYGAGGHGVVVAEIAAAVGYQIAGLIDDDPEKWGEAVGDWSVIGGLDKIPEGASVAFGIGNNYVRERLISKASENGWKLPVLVHPSAAVSPSARLGDGTVVMSQVAVNAGARVGQGCVLNSGCSVDHDCVLADCVHVGPGAHLGGTVRVGSRSLVGIGSCIIPNVNIGEGVVIGAGAAVVRDMPDEVTAVGVPARPRG